jgi:hypothetical protein
MKSSQVISYVSMELISSISETISVASSGVDVFSVLSAHIYTKELAPS